MKNLLLPLLLAALLSPAYAADSAVAEPQPLPTPAMDSLAAGKSVSLPPAKDSVSSPKLLVQPDDGRTAIIDAINNAKSTIDLTIYELADGLTVGALQKAEQRGVKVRVLYNYYSFMHYSFNPNSWAISQLQPAGVELKQAPKTFSVTHQKTFVIDGTTAIIMTFNLQKNYFTNTRDFGYITSDPALVGEVSRVFEADWNGTSITPSQAALVWSPTNSRAKITALITGAKKTLDIYAEEARDNASMNAICDAAKRGVKVRFINAALKDHNGGSTDPNQAGRDQLTGCGVTVKVGAGSYYVHAKMVMPDYGTSDGKAFIGSENFSYTSLDKNRELGVLITDSSMLSTLENTFTTDWAK